MDLMAAVRVATPIVGRGRELDRLAGLTDAAVGGQARGVLLAGDAGVGKTTLVGELSRRAGERGMLTLVGRCVDLGTGGLPYLPFAEALTQLVRAGDAAGGGPAAAAARAVREVGAERAGLARLAGRLDDVPDRAPGDAGLDRLALFDAVMAVLSRLAADVAPVLLIIEDLHWADASTRDLVRFLLSRLDDDRLLVVATYRTDDLHRRHPLRPLLAELVRLPSVERVELAPFTVDELGAFLAAVGGRAVPGGIVREIAARSGGNAYFAEELLAAGPGDGRLPTGLADVLLDRLERLDPLTQKIVRYASVIGSCRLDDGLLHLVAADAAALSDEDTDRALRDAVAHHVLIPEGEEQYCFRHALLQEAVYEDLLPGERVRLHSVVARRLAEAGQSTAAEEARHSLAAHELPQALAASLRAAVDARRRLAPAEALAHYEQAIQLWEPVSADLRPADQDLIDVALAAAAAASDAGEHERAVALARSALDEALRGDRTRAATVRGRLALHVYATEDMEEAREQARRTVADLPAEPSAARVWAWAIEARVDGSFGEAEAAEAIIHPALAESRQLGLLTAEADLLITLAGVEGTLGRDGGERYLAEARTVAERAGDQGIVLRAVYNTAMNLFEAGDLSGALSIIREALEIAGRSGLSGSLYATQCRWLEVTARWFTADVAGALAGVDAARRELPRPQARQIALAALPMHVARDPQAALDLAETLRRDEPAWDAPARLGATADALSWLGRHDEAAATATEALDALDAHGDPYQLSGIWMNAIALGVLANQADDARRRGDAETASRAVAEGKRFLTDGRERGTKGRPRRRELGPEGRAWLARVEAEAARLDGAGSAELWRTAIAEYATFTAYEQARSRWRLAEQLLLDGDRDGARTEAVAAQEAARALGAQPLLTAVQDLARRGRLDIGARPAPRGGELTPREREVMRLVADGLTNRQIGERLYISEKTASVHVSNVLTKLGASGRAEAVALATRRDLI